MFKNAIGIWGKDKDLLNETLFFTLRFKKDDNLKIKITSSNFYRLFLNGKFIYYGPARSAHNIFEVDEYDFKKIRDVNYLVIEVNSQRAETFYTLNQKPFLKAEIFKNDESIYFTGRDFKCFLDKYRVKEVDRFSYQRGFSEVYYLDNSYPAFLRGRRNTLEKCEIELVNYGEFIKRIPDYLTYSKVNYHLVENGYIHVNEDKKVHDDRYFHMDILKIFPKNQIIEKVNETISKLDYFKGKDNKRTYHLFTKEFATFKNKDSITGFINLKLDVKKESTLYIIFDEIDMNEYQGIQNEVIDISPFRNTTQNVVTYYLKKGRYNLISFEPYTAKFVRVICFDGEVKIIDLNLISYRNSSVKFEYKFQNRKFKKVIESAINTFKDNAVDVLTDCPSRERAGWLCDSYFTSKVEKILTGENKVEYNFLKSYSDYKDNCQLDKFMIPMCYPAEHAEKTYIPNWSLFYILELENYLKRNGDYKLIEASKEKIIDLISYFKKFENEFGLLENLKSWVFVERSKAGDPEFLKGVNFPTNMLYSCALKAAGRLLNVSSLIEKGNKLQETIEKMAFCNDFFVDNAIRDEKNELKLTQNISETCQYYAFYFLDGTVQKYPGLFKKMIYKFGPYRDEKVSYPHVFKSNVFIGNYLRLMILNKNSLYKIAYKEIVNYYYKMARLTSTLWEHDSPHASLNHGFASYVLNIIVELIFGLKDILVKEKEILIDKNALHKDGEVKIPVEEKYLILKCKKGKTEIIPPEGFSIKYLKEY